MAIRREPDAANDKLDAAERGIEWGAAILKARRSVRPARQLCRTLGVGPQVTAQTGSREQEALFEGLRAFTARLGTAWDCTIEGGGNRLRVRLVGSVSKEIAWSCAGSGAQVLAAFAQWLVTSSPS
jgi:hypothetical protein